MDTHAANRGLLKMRVDSRSNSSTMVYIGGDRGPRDD